MTEKLATEKIRCIFYFKMFSQDGSGYAYVYLKIETKNRRKLLNKTVFPYDSNKNWFFSKIHIYGRYTKDLFVKDVNEYCTVGKILLL